MFVLQELSEWRRSLQFQHDRSGANPQQSVVCVKSHRCCVLHSTQPGATASITWCVHEWFTWCLLQSGSSISTMTRSQSDSRPHSTSPTHPVLQQSNSMPTSSPRQCLAIMLHTTGSQYMYTCITLTKVDLLVKHSSSAATSKRFNSAKQQTRPTSRRRRSRWVTS